ncbi:uncharacterized protein G2W53_028530 [Senna tora]|uniref:Uncharacterized protein n=1 Tax=Senna tora TaxID=362788 RepID=A0A834T5J9_9FABA|nr:uncharacterized protein G2W53_028530 [Senna tora]
MEVQENDPLVEIFRRQPFGVNTTILYSRKLVKGKEEGNENSRNWIEKGDHYNLGGRLPSPPPPPGGSPPWTPGSFFESTQDDMLLLLGPSSPKFYANH